jgi:hypothetical protein
MLLHAATAWGPVATLIAPAVAESEPADPQLSPRHRRLLAARLSDRLNALKRDAAVGKKLVLGDPARWKDIFNGEDDGALPRLLPNSTDNIYEAAIKEYVRVKRPDEKTPWNQWPKDEERDFQERYVGCVLRKIDYFFETRWGLIRQRIADVNKGTGAGALSTRIRGALTFTGEVFNDYLRFNRLEKLDGLDSKEIEELDPQRKCPDGPRESREEALNTEPLSVGWNANCLKSEEQRRDRPVQPYHPTAAALMYDNGRRGFATYCTGTLIAPNAVLTAAHCVCDTGAKDPSGPFYRTASSCVNGTYTRLGREVSTLEPRHQRVFLQHAGHFEVSDVVVHPLFRWTDALPFSDLAILFLKTPVPPEIVPMKLNTLGRLPVTTRGAAVGYGAHNPIGASGEVTDTGTVEEPAGLKLQANVETAYCGLYGRQRNLICWRYRTSDRFGMRLGSTCRGDSGGPLYAVSDDQTYLVGVTSGGGASCQPDATAAFDIEVYPYKDWIDRELTMNPPPRDGNPSRASQGGRSDGSGMRQVACHFCPMCDQLSATINIPVTARRLQVSVNCTPDEITRRGDVTLKVAVGDREEPCHGPGGTALSCAVPVEPNLADPRTTEARLTLNSGLLQQCQIVATAFDRAGRTDAPR